MFFIEATSDYELSTKNAVEDLWDTILREDGTANN